MNYNEYEKKVKINYKRNEEFLREFKNWLMEKELSPKTIRKHVNNISLYINDYLNYYDAKEMEQGINSVDRFLGGWFIEKCLWSSKNSIKDNATSIKKFYECMSELGYVSNSDYKELCNEIKNNMDEYLNDMDAYNNGTYFDIF